MYSAIIVIGFFCIAAIVLWRYAAVQPEIRQYRKLQLAKAYWAKMLEQGQRRSQ